MPLDVFETDWQRQWLVERGIEIISEASRHLTDEMKARHPEIPWQKVADRGSAFTPARLMSVQPAHQSLFTDVFGSRLLLCTNHQCKNFTMSPRGDGKPCAVCLTGDIRMGWSGCAGRPAEGRRWKSATV